MLPTQKLICPDFKMLKILKLHLLVIIVINLYSRILNKFNSTRRNKEKIKYAQDTNKMWNLFNRYSRYKLANFIVIEYGY